MDKQAAAAHRHPWKISDVVVFPLAGLGLAAEWLMPSHVPFLPGTMRIATGTALAIVGVALIIWSKRSLSAAAQPGLPGLPTTQLVTIGAYRISRNPNYLGAVLAVFSGGLLSDSLWLTASAIASALILQFWMISPEERYLMRRFPVEYAAYCERVRRWV